MILKASQRSGAKQLGQHLLKTEENEHVEIHEVSGFVSDDVMGAMQEAYPKVCAGSSERVRGDNGRVALAINAARFRVTTFLVQLRPLRAVLCTGV